MGCNCGNKKPRVMTTEQAKQTTQREDPPPSAPSRNVPEPSNK